MGGRGVRQAGGGGEEVEDILKRVGGEGEVSSLSCHAALVWFDLIFSALVRFVLVRSGK